MKRSNRGAGFTLIELLVSLGIIGAVSVGLGGALKQGLESWKRGKQVAEEQQEARVILERLGRELRNAFPAPRAALAGAETSLAFYTTRELPASADGPSREAVKVVYRTVVGGADFKSRVERVETPVSSPARAETRTLTEGPSEMSFAFAFSPEQEGEDPLWKPSWPAVEDFPRAIRIRLSLDAGGDGARAFEKSVLFPTGKLVKWTARGDF